ncbi:MAG: polysaccharide pyruvyl transferase family protein [Clostridiales bacterium]|nr:polysaccharide pyruvyl transferase family protein [Clostridiales bacterium]
MKIGLLTVFYANYGSYYQAVALQKQLEQLGHECQIINASIRGKVATKFLLGVLGEKYLPNKVLDLIDKKNIPFKTYRAIKNALQDDAIGPIVFKAKKLNKTYDCIIVGSDELWSATLDIMHYIPVYFGKDIRVPHMAYSTSAISLKDPPPEMESEMRKGINTFSAISVRDSETQQWIKKWTGKEVPITLDPTLLFPFFEREKRSGGGIIVYGEHFEEKHIDLIKKYAEKNHYPIHSVCWPLKWCDDFIDAQSPQALLDLFNSADFCVVSTFHGTIFSLLNHQNFAAFCAPKRTNKIKGLLSQLEMGSCFWDENRDDEIEFSGDYSVFEKNIQVLRDRSLEYLTDALKTMEKEIKD